MKVEFYWLVMLLAHSGCRATEVLQLMRSDLRTEDGVVCLDVTGGTGRLPDANNRKVKNRFSIRRVPVHSAVLKAGLLDWIQDGTGERLFPQLFPYGAVKLSLDFTRLLKQVKVKRPS